MISRPRVALTLLAALFLLVLPSVASAALYTVNTKLDEPDAVSGGICETAAGKCSLRAAIEDANLSLAERDNIEFSLSVFEGRLTDTIEPVTPLPAITAPLTINGASCMVAAGPGGIGPCVGINGPSGQNVLTVEADNTAIFGLAITGGSTGVDVINASTEFTARGNWIGLKLDGSNGGNANTGIFIDPDSNEATIGGSEAIQRNIISFNSVGLDIEGADDAVVRGNWFGVKTDGTGASGVAKNIEISDSTSGSGFHAEGNEIGEALAQGPTETSACDGGCNVVSGAAGAGGVGVDLNGNGALLNEAPSTGPTFVRGNFIGVNPTGTGSVVNGAAGIYAGGADNATIGGYSPGEANYFSGSSEAIVSENGESFIVRGNRIGVSPGGAELTRPGLGVFALDQSVTEAPSIEQNVVRAGNVGIEQRGSTGHITGNDVEGGSVAIYAKGEPGGGLIAGNHLEGASEYGVLVDGPNQEVRENEVIGSGAAGIRFRNPPGIAMTGGVIGGNTSQKENLIEGSGGPAIEILEEALEPGSATEITRNHGSSNGGPFIKLVGGANGGIEPPALATVLQSSANGTAEPNATVRVFSKAAAEAGELQAFLAETAADGSGNWKVAFPVLAAGTLVTATQTVAGATSQLASPLAAASESKEEETGGGGGGGGGNNGGGSSGGNNNGGGNAGKDTTPPDTKITQGPPKKTHKTTVKLKFTATEGGSTFQCKLDRKPFKTCRSPKTYKKLKPGRHVFKVRAIDKAGNVDPTPAKRKFTVVR